MRVLAGGMHRLAAILDGAAEVTIIGYGATQRGRADLEAAVRVRAMALRLPMGAAWECELRERGWGRAGLALLVLSSLGAGVWALAGPVRSDGAALSCIVAANALWFVPQCLGRAAARALRGGRRSAGNP